ncbi:MAG: DUF6070 family protein [bacterium]|nr:DUF6070 family protein [bacterium]
MQKSQMKRIFLVSGILFFSLLILFMVMIAGKKLNINQYLISSDFVKGIDVSHYQGEIDWKQIKNQNITFAFIKATEGSGYVDETFLYNWEQAKQAGITTGAYHFFSFDSPAEDQARLFIQTVGDLNGRLIPVIDIEYYGDYETNPPAVDTVTSQLQKLLILLEQEYHAKPAIYTTYQVYNRYLKDHYKDYPLWIRNVYYPPKNLGRQWIFWQYSDTGRLFGMHGTEECVDLNVFHGNQTELENYKLDGVNRDKGYDLVISDTEQKNAENDCCKLLELVRDIYQNADKGNTSNTVLSSEALTNMTDRIAAEGYCVGTTESYSSLDHYEAFEDFLHTCAAGNSGTAITYCVYSDGKIGRNKYIFDGQNMYLLAARGAWSDDRRPVVPYMTYAKIQKWEYTEHGWLRYQLCVPEYPDVTEVVNGNCLVRVRPMDEEFRKMSEKCVFHLGYQGNNLLCSDWDADNMKNIDYNGLYEYLYEVKNQQKYNPDTYKNGIPKEEFESLITYYLPITAEKLQDYAVYDEEKQTYKWTRLGCSNYNPTAFGMSVPEVTAIEQNDDGTVTLTVNGICEMLSYEDSTITHKLTVKFMEDGHVRYIDNHVLYCSSEIPEYQSRISFD